MKLDIGLPIVNDPVQRPSNPSLPNSLISVPKITMDACKNHQSIQPSIEITNENHLVVGAIENHLHPSTEASEFSTTLFGLSNLPKEEENVYQDSLQPFGHFWIFGDMQFLTDYLDRWSFCSLLFPLKLLNAILRTYSAPLLVNNPVSGLFIALAVGLSSSMAVVCCTLAIIWALFICMVFLHSQHIISSGLPSQHAFLITLGAVKALNHHSLDIVPTTIFFIVLTALR